MSQRGRARGTPSRSCRQRVTGRQEDAPNLTDVATLDRRQFTVVRPGRAGRPEPAAVGAGHSRAQAYSSRLSDQINITPSADGKARLSGGNAPEATSSIRLSAASPVQFGEPRASKQRILRPNR